MKEKGGEQKMGAVEQYQDAAAREDWGQAFKLALEILNRKGSKRLMDDWAEACYQALGHLGKAYLLPASFPNLSCYGQRDELNKVQL